MLLSLLIVDISISVQIAGHTKFNIYNLFHKIPLLKTPVLRLLGKNRRAKKTLRTSCNLCGSDPTGPRFPDHGGITTPQRSSLLLFYGLTAQLLPAGGWSVVIGGCRPLGWLTIRAFLQA